MITLFMTTGEHGELITFLGTFSTQALAESRARVAAKARGIEVEDMQWMPINNTHYATITYGEDDGVQFVAVEQQMDVEVSIQLTYE